MGPFLGGLGPQNETLPGTIRSTFGSRFQLPFWVPPRAGQRFSGRSACYHSQLPNLICQTPSVSFLLPPSCSFFCLLRSFNLIAKRPGIQCTHFPISSFLLPSRRLQSPSGVRSPVVGLQPPVGGFQPPVVGLQPHGGDSTILQPKLY